MWWDIPGGTKATIVGVDEEGDLPVFTDDGKTMATWCSIWLQVWERQCGPLDHASQPVQHCNCRNRMSKQHRKTSKNSFAKPSNVLLQIRWILCRSTSRGLAFWVFCQCSIHIHSHDNVLTQKYQAPLCRGMLGSSIWTRSCPVALAFTQNLQSIVPFRVVVHVQVPSNCTLGFACTQWSDSKTM